MISNIFKQRKTVRVNSLPNGWVDKDELILHTNFSILADYVEIELALEQIRWFESESMELDFREYFIGKIKDSDLIRTKISPKDRIKIMLYNNLPGSLRSDELVRSKELGLKRLNCIISDASNIEDSEKFIEIKRLYLWWVEGRDRRADPDIESGYQTYMDNNTLTETSPDGSVQLHPLSDELLSKIEHSIEIEQKYYEEDTEMLKRLMDIRNFLWA
jgi:hypothetical protein